MAEQERARRKPGPFALWADAWTGGPAAPMLRLMAALLSGAETRLAAPQGALAAALARLEDAAPAIVTRTEAWSRINSGSYETANLARMRDALIEAFSVLPAPVERIALASCERIAADGGAIQTPLGDALRLRVRPDAPVQAALTGHYDTMFPAASPFQAPQVVDGDILNGPGCADMKGGLSLMLAALEAFETLAPKRVGYTLLLSPDEEIGSPGSARLLAQIGAGAHVGMTYEPALPDGAMAGARKGSGNYALVFRGRAAHVGRAFTDGRSAIAAAARATLDLLECNGKHAGVTFNVGAIDGGGPVNQVPDRAVVRFNARAPDAAGALWAEAEIARIVTALDGRDGVRAQVHGGFTRPPKPMTPQQERLIGWTRAAGDLLGLALPFAPTGGVCEGNNLAAAGCPNIDTLGPCGGELHCEREFARIASFAPRAKLSLLLLAGFESGVFDAPALRG